MENKGYTRYKGSTFTLSFKTVNDINELLQQFGDYERFMPMTQALESKSFIVPPYIPKEKGYSQARFMGRLVGFNAAAWNDKRTPRMIKNTLEELN